MKNQLRVRTKKDEWDDFKGGLISLGLILFGCIGVCAGILKVVGLNPEYGIPAGILAWVLLVIKYKWMRGVMIEAIWHVALVAAILGVFLLLI